MFTEIPYDREAAVFYARKWAFLRNPRYYNFDDLGGDCTNFVSQCIYAGCGVMNFTPTFGWYYIDVNQRAPAWTGVEFLSNFLTTNTGAGPFAEEVAQTDLAPGDIVQLIDGSGKLYHTLIVVAIRRGRIYVASHSADSFLRRLNTYTAAGFRFFHILGARK
ncbi:MAG: amidase domain-containing protein [Oscillospiraceae bacterium]|nr:amidase domain-containing protein [Oscillospiraceae bacterium]